jgi:serine/threonine protein kinase
MFIKIKTMKTAFWASRDSSSNHEPRPFRSALQTVAGTPIFMAPELLRGESRPTRESDVYAFGILIYESVQRLCILERGGGHSYHEVGHVESPVLLGT